MPYKDPNRKKENQKQYNLKRKITSPQATCHPDKKAKARGLCSACLQKEYKKENKNKKFTEIRSVIVPSGFYTYLWLREDGTPYYVGKGQDNRALYRYSRGVQPPTDDRIIIQSFETESDSLFAEKFLISFYGRKDLGEGILHNRTDGGEGISGAKHSFGKMSREHAEKISRALKGRKKSVTHRKNISKGRLGIVFTEIHKMRIGQHQKDNPRTYSLETRRKLSDAANKRWSSAEKKTERDQRAPSVPKPRRHP